jgi:hypothetical protein
LPKQKHLPSWLEPTASSREVGLSSSLAHSLAMRPRETPGICSPPLVCPGSMARRSTQPTTSTLRRIHKKSM